jgi:ribosome-associated protein
MTFFTEDEDTDDIPISRTKMKKNDRARQMLGEKLVELPENQLERIDLPDELKEEIFLARKTTAHGARRRQIKYIGSLLRNYDVIPIEKALEIIDRGDYEQKLVFKKLENCRDQLKAGNIELINEILIEYPLANRQKLTQLARNAKKESEGNKGSKSSKALFRYLKEVFGN